jgi:hypothetical protein
MANTARTTDESERELIAEIAREQVAALAPQELPLFRRTSQAFFERPGELERRGSGGDVLGFGVGGAVTYLTPIVLAIIVEVVSFLAGELKKQLQLESTAAIAALVKRLFKRFRDESGTTSGAATGGTATGGTPGGASKQPAVPSLPGLSQQQVERVRTLVLERAKALNLSEAQAELLADSLAGGLVRAA